MGLNVLAWDSDKDRPVRTDKDASLIGTGSAGNRSGSVSLTQGDLTKTVTFDTPMTTTSYAVNAEFFNSTDASVLYQDMVITNKTVNGFTAKWNYPVDSNNFKLEYTASIYGYSFLSASVVLALNSTVKTVTINPPFVTTDYIVTVNFSNQVDTDITYQPITVTTKATSYFTVKWNQPLDTTNYYLEYHINLP